MKHSYVYVLLWLWFWNLPNFPVTQQSFRIFVIFYPLILVFYVYLDHNIAGNRSLAMTVNLCIHGHSLPLNSSSYSQCLPESSTNLLCLWTWHIEFAAVHLADMPLELVYVSLDCA